MFARTARNTLTRSWTCSRCLSSTPRHLLPAVAEPTSTTTPDPKYPISKVVTIQTTRLPIDRSQIPLMLQIPVPNPTSEPYTITRTPSKGLPVYELRKGGGTLKLTRVRKIDGEREALKKQLERELVPKPEYVKINPVTGHIVIKVGHREHSHFTRSAEGSHIFRATTRARSMISSRTKVSRLQNLSFCHKYSCPRKSIRHATTKSRKGGMAVKEVIP